MAKDADADIFVDCLLRATGQIEPVFFALPVSYGPDHTIYRERAYCYELYHQLRLTYSAKPYTLNGEISKAAHPEFDGMAKTPDLLVHVPGTMAGNLVIVEVKSAIGVKNAEDVKGDLAKLTAFVSLKEYERGVYVVYGDTGRPIEKVRRIAADWERETGHSLQRTHLVWHRHPGVVARDVGWR